MENIFNFNRFGLLVRKHINENRRLFLIAIVCMFVPALLLRLIMNDPEPRHMYVFYIAFMIYTGMIYTGLFFKRWTVKSRAISFFMLPVTIFEKIAVLLFFTIVLFIPIFTLVYYFSSMALFTITNPTLSFSIDNLLIGHSVLSAFCLCVLLPFALVQSFFLLIAVWFKKNQIFYALAIFGLILLVSNFLLTVYMKTLTGGNVNGIGIGNFIFPLNVSFHNEGSITEITSQMISTISVLVYVVMTLLFYLASYFKLKEKEI